MWTIYLFPICDRGVTFKLFIFVRTFVRIYHRRTLEFVGNLILLLKIPNFSIWLSESCSIGRILVMVVEIRLNRPKSDDVTGFWRTRFQPAWSVQLDSNPFFFFFQILTSLAGILKFLLESNDGCRIPFYAIDIFLYESNNIKYFLEKSFFFPEK